MSSETEARMGSLDTVQDGAVVLLTYRLSNERGQPLDAPTGPVAYLHGRGNLVRGFEAALAGRQVGDRIHAVVVPEDAFGPRAAGEPMSIPKGWFKKGFRLVRGASFRAAGEDGQEITLYVVKTEGRTVRVDGNHPLAGMTLVFDAVILAIRAATPDEVRLGYATQPAG